MRALNICMQIRCETVILRFSRDEVEAVKARAMGPLAGALSID